jgi:hypothetical protein
MDASGKIIFKTACLSLARRNVILTAIRATKGVDLDSQLIGRAASAAVSKHNGLIVTHESCQIKLCPCIRRLRR